MVWVPQESPWVDVPAPCRGTPGRQRVPARGLGPLPPAWETVNSLRLWVPPPPNVSPPRRPHPAPPSPTRPPWLQLCNGLLFPTPVALGSCWTPAPQGHHGCCFPSPPRFTAALSSWLCRPHRTWPRGVSARTGRKAGSGRATGTAAAAWALTPGKWGGRVYAEGPPPWVLA